MLYYYLFWMFMGFIIHFDITFGTNLLTGGPARIAFFFAYFSVSKKRNIKRSPNGMKPSGELFLERKQSRRLGVDVREASRKPRGREARPTPWARPPPLWAPHGSPGRLLSPIYISTYPENIHEHHETLFPPLQPSIPVRSHLGPFPAICRRGNRSQRASTSTP